MARLIKRYGSRKLYDTQESRYISLEEIADWVRTGEEIKVIDNASTEDVTALTLTQVISEEGRKKSQFLSSDLLHDLIRTGETMVSSRVKLFQDGVEGFVKKSLDRLVPVSKVRDEMNHLRDRLEELEKTLVEAEAQAEEPHPVARASAQAAVTTETEASSETPAEPAAAAEPAATPKKTVRRARKTSGTTTTRTRRKKATSNEEQESQA